MPKYFTEVERWLSHECRLVPAGTTFETTFPEGMKLADTIKEIKDAPARAPRVKPEPASDSDSLT